MKNFTKIFSISLLMLIPFRVHAADDVNQGNNVPKKLYEKLMPIVVPENASANVRKKEEQIKTLLQTSTAEWGDFAHELVQVMHLEKRPEILDGGFLRCFNIYDILTTVANRCLELDASSSASYMLLLNSMDDAFKNKHDTLCELEKRHNENPRDINICLQYSWRILQWLMQFR